MVHEFLHRIMGSAASTNVKEIKIEQSDNRWDRIQQPAKDKKRGFSISKRWVSSADADSSSNRRTKQLASSLEAAEKRALESELRVRQLEREVGTLDLRNMELAEEVSWLKKQLSDRPEVPILPRPSTAASLKSKVNVGDTLEEYKSKQVQYVDKLEGQVRRYEEDILKLKTKLNQDTKRLQAEMEDQKLTHDRQMRVVDNHLISASKLNEVYEDVIRDKLSAETLADVKSKVMSDFNQRPQSSSAVLNGEASNNKSRAQLILELSEQITKQKDKIRLLENDIVKRDVEIVHLKEMMNSSEAMLHASLNAATLRKASDTSSTLNNNKQRPIFSATRRNSASLMDSSKPMKADRSGDAIRDEIEALLLQSSANDVDFELLDSPKSSSKNSGLSQSAGALLLRSANLSKSSIPKEKDEDGSNSDDRSKKGNNKRTISAPKKTTTFADSTSNAVYTFSDESFDGKQDFMSSRPKTAYSNPNGARPKGSLVQNKTTSQVDQFYEIEEEPREIFSYKNRIKSAPMIFKPRPPSREEHRADKARSKLEKQETPDTRQSHADVEVMSLNDVDVGKDEHAANFEADDCEAEPKLEAASVSRKPPIPAKRHARNPGSAASLYSSSAVGSGDENETSDEEIRRLLEKRGNRPNKRSTVGGGSAKSRDSGFLGESYTSSQSAHLWQNDTDAPDNGKRTEVD